MSHKIHHRIVWFTIGGIALALGVVGLLLPLLPTTPFVLVAAYSFARSSERCHRWLVHHRIFGPLIRNWQEYGAISRSAKITSAIFISAVFLLSLIMGVAKIVIVIQFFILAAILIFIWSRPLPP